MSERAAEATIFSIGHSNRTLESFIALLKSADITMVADIRTVPRSRSNPQFNADALPLSLKEAEIKYKHFSGLGGLRHPAPDSINTGWRNPSFRGFADYMQTPAFAESLQELITLSKQKVVVIMCAEAVPWRCHRSLIADALLVRGIQVEHIISATSRRPHKLTPWAHIEGKRITYPPPAL
jgi:uncharacterized protein (DUF488 family)